METVNKAFCCVVINSALCFCLWMSWLMMRNHYGINLLKFQNKMKWTTSSKHDFARLLFAQHCVPLHQISAVTAPPTMHLLWLMRTGDCAVKSHHSGGKTFLFGLHKLRHFKDLPDAADTDSVSNYWFVWSKVTDWFVCIVLAIKLFIIYYLFI